MRQFAHMNTIRCSLLILIVTFYAEYTSAQQSDSAAKQMVYSGSIGLTTNGFSIIPSFSLNSPAVIAFLSWRRNKFSIDPDIRLTPDLRKGGILIWLRYYAVEKKKFSLRVGAHPAVNIQERILTENGSSSNISQFRRFLAWELVPNYNITKNLSVGLYYLQGHGLQKDGPRTTHFVTFNSGISNIKAGKMLRLSLYPAIYYLYVDGYKGKYFTATVALAHTRLPFSLESSINQTFTSSLPGNKDYMWNLTLKYNFNKTFLRIQ